MLQFFPFAAYLAVVTSTTLLAILWSAGDLEHRQGLALAGWLIVAAYCQFFGSSMTLVAGGLALQTILALYLIVYWKFQA